MAGEKAEKLHTNGRKPEAKKTDVSGEVRKGDPKAQQPKKGKPHRNPNPGLVRGISRCSQPCHVFLQGVYKGKYSTTEDRIETKRKVLASVTKPAGGATNGGTRVVKLRKKPRYYPTEDVPRKLLIHGKKTLQLACEKAASQHHSQDHLTLSLDTTEPETGFREAAEHRLATVT
ncbi:60S ribosomal protein L6 [Tupaia chinensis]|uniref:60S ribosomal protein L6 n=1 Tax=Tupaia chinensis TaxID=246437 RepID=L9LAZ0_TUPCH|nr:60S ribosomal protein L6 [Tupaia chinensis]